MNQLLSAIEISEIESKLGYVFKDKSLLVCAFTHSSLSGKGQKSNERLEFLGDRVLNFIAAEKLYFDGGIKESNLSEKLSSQVSEEPLYNAIKKLDILKYYKTDKGTDVSSLKKKKVSDIFEALVCAIYLDSQDLKNVKDFIFKTLVATDKENYIGKIKEYLEKNKDVNWSENYIKTDKGFEFSFIIGDKKFDGTDQNLKDAEKKAKQKACENLKI